MRLVALVALLVASVSWPCTFTALVQDSPGPKGLTLKWREAGPSWASGALVDGAGVVWSWPLNGSFAVFTDDLVAMPSGQGETVQVVTLAAPPRQMVIAVKPLFQPGEVPGARSSCGIRYLGRLSFVEGGLSLELLLADGAKRTVVVPLKDEAFTPVPRVSLGGFDAAKFASLMDSRRDALVACAPLTGDYGASVSLKVSPKGRGKRRTLVETAHAKLKQCLERALQGWPPPTDSELGAELEFASWRH